MSAANGRLLTRDDLLAPIELPREPVALPGLGTVWVRAVTAEEREVWESAAKHRIRATLVALAACDAEGRTLFTLADVPALAARASSVLLPVFEAALRLAKVAPEDVDGLEKDSGATPADSSPIDSPPASA